MTFPKTISLLLAGAALAAGPATANAADQLVTAAPGAQSLTSGGGYLAWAAPAPGGGFRLTVRASNGTVTTPQVATFDRAPHISIGSSAMTSGRKLVAVYDRGGDVFQLDLASGTETKVAGVSSSA